MKKLILILAIGYFPGLLFSQSYIPYGSYLSATGGHGQPAIAYQLADNILYAAEERFTATSTHGQNNIRYLFNGIYDQSAIYVPNSQSAIITVDFVAKGGAPITYGDGFVYVSFYWTNNTQSVTGRIQVQNGTWYNIGSWTNISNNVNTSVMRGSMPTINYVTKLEVTVTATTATPALISQLEYQMTRYGQYERGLVTKFEANTLWKQLSWKNSSNVLTASIDQNGAAFFNSSVGVGTSTPNTNAKLDVNGNIFSNGKIAIGTTDMTKIGPYALAVNGEAIFNKARVKLYSTWPDYVFHQNYQLPTLREVEHYIQKNKHLPGIPSAAEVEEEGIDLGNNQALLLKKIEELTLYLIQQQKEITALQKEIEQLKKQPVKQ